MEQGMNSLKHLEEVTCEIKLKLPSLNDYIKACRSNKFQASVMKKETEKAISLFTGKLKEFTKPVTIHFTWIEENSKRDCDNIAFSKKFILDALVKQGKLIDDSQKYVKGFTDEFKQGNEAKVIIEIQEI